MRSSSLSRFLPVVLTAVLAVSGALIPAAASADPGSAPTPTVLLPTGTVPPECPHEIHTRRRSTIGDRRAGDHRSLPCRPAVGGERLGECGSSPTRPPDPPRRISPRRAG
ncbi:hypothetical protein MUG78_11245 [Gordonia alkaliphila]|uniref:hypothetical protein n=1 Tax=Gordonia alkaliphila TaxID=1053547 RepID=UPI001FF17428|nr:hypothetical protein [Gordonia alkaliphila]MCK0440012.1 hypothetical protein [Gordonia alkaliphila]